MKIKFNLFERVAGLFVLAAFGGAVAVSLSVAYKKGWFSAKIPFQATFKSAEGLHVGTKVQIAGIRAGSVTEVLLQENNEVIVKFSVLEKFYERIREDSEVQLVRAFVIGEKILDVTAGSPKLPRIKKGQAIAVKDSMDLMDLLSGRELGNYLASMGQLTKNLGRLVDAFSDTSRLDSLIESLDEINPLIKNLNKMSMSVSQLTGDLNQKKKVSRLVGNLANATDQLKPHLPALLKESPKTLKNVATSLENLVALSNQLKKLVPALTEVAPDMPRTARRLIEAVDEAVITMKAIQKTFFVRGKVAEVKKEEAKEKKKRNRMPASR